MNELDRLIEIITVDAYDVSEQVTAFFEAFNAEVPLPTSAVVLGITVDIVDFDIADNGEDLMIRCRRGDVVQDLHLVDVTFPADTPAGWVHAAYRRCLGLKPFPAEVPAE